MKLLPLILSILISSGSLVVKTGLYGQAVQNILADSLRKEALSEVGVAKISTQLELALLIFENENQEAKVLAQSALAGAQEIGDKVSQMRAYYIYGRILLDADDIAQSLIYYDSALYISNLIGDTEYKGEILFRKGVNYYNINDQVKALETYREALAACREADDFKVRGSIYSMMGTIYRVNGIYDRAIEYNIRASLNYEKANFEEGYAWINYLLGRIYADLNSSQKALGYFEESLRIYERIASLDGNENGVAICHEQIALQELNLGNYENARLSIDEVLNIHKRGGSKYGISSAYTIYGKIEYSAKNFPLAEDYLRKSLDLKEEIEDLKGFSVVYEFLGLCLVAKGQVNDGIQMIKQGLHQAELNNQRKIQLDINKKLAAIYLSANNQELANFYQNEVIEIQDELLFGAASIKMEQLQSFYEIEEKNSQILELEQENELNSLRIQKHRSTQILMIIGILLAVFIAVVIFLFNRRIEQNNLQLKKLNITKDKLFSIISHDLRGPVGTALGLSEVLLEKIEDKNGSDLKLYSHSLYNNLCETHDLMTNLLQWAQAQFKGIKSSPETLSMNHMANIALKPVANSAERKHIKITVDIDDKISVWADRSMLTAILRNLISNAIKFSNEHGTILIHAIQRNRRTEVCIEDNGIGMSSETLDKLFSLHSNSSTFGTAGEKGTGLGLILCKDFVEMQKGEIWVESTPNKGSSFFFTIPFRD